MQPCSQVVAHTYKEIMYHVDAEPASGEIAQPSCRARFCLDADAIDQQEASQGHHGYIRRVVGPEKLHLLRSLVGKLHDVAVAAIGDDESAYQQGECHGTCLAPTPMDVVLDVVAEEHVSAESGKVIEQAEGIPFASAEGITADIFIEVREHGT